MLTFGQRVQAARKAKGLTLEQLATAIHSHKGYICGIEMGVHNPPSSKFVARICKRLDLPPDEMHALAFWEKRDPEVVSARAMAKILEEAAAAPPVILQAQRASV